MNTTADFGSPLLPSGSVAQPEILHNEAVRRNEVLAAGIAHGMRSTPTGSEVDGDVIIVDGVGSGDFEDQDNKVAFLFGGSWRFIPDVTGSSVDIPIGARHAGLRMYLQDDGSSPPVPGWKLWDGSAWIDD